METHRVFQTAGMSLQSRSDHEHANESATVSGCVGGWEVRCSGLGDLGFLSRLRPVSAAEAALDPEGRAARARDRALGPSCSKRPRATACSRRWPRGSRRASAIATSWRRCSWPAFGTCSRGPSVGHKFHAVLVVNSAHLASLASPDSDRWLPIFWALDYFKDSQARDVKRRQLDHGAGRRVGRAAGAQGQSRRSPPRWTTGTRPPPTRRSPDSARSCRRERDLRDLLPLRRAGLSLDRPQGDLRGQQSADTPVHRLAARRAGSPLAGLRALESQRRRQPRQPRLRGRPLVAAQPGPRRPRSRKTGPGRTSIRRRGRAARHAPPGLRRRGVRPRSRALEPRRRPAVDLGCPVRRRGRAPAAPARARVVARGDHHQRTSFRVPGQRRRPHPAPAHAAERRVPALVPRRHGGARQGARGADRSARAARRVGGSARVRSRRSSRTPVATG